MTDVEGKLPIEIAARSNVDYICKELLKHVKDMSTKGDPLSIKGKVAREASEVGHLDILKVVLYGDSKDGPQQSCSKEMPNILRQKDADEYTCLHLAARQGHLSNSLFLLFKSLSLE